MKLTLKLETTAKYISFWNSIFKLTSKELSILLDFGLGCSVINSPLSGEDK